MSNPNTMHGLIISPYPLQSTFLINTLKRYNIDSRLMQPKYIHDDFVPETDVLVFPHRLDHKNWRDLKSLLSNLGKRIPLLVIGSINRAILSGKEFKKFWGRCIFVDEAVKMTQIPEIVRETVECSRNLNESLLKLEDVSLNRRRRELDMNGKKVFLNRKEYYLLELLIRNAGQITTRESILEYVWDRRAFVSQNTIDVYISRLRKKIDSESKNSFISTIPCLGYQIVKKETLQN